jgi:hypothetical protein
MQFAGVTLPQGENRSIGEGGSVAKAGANSEALAGSENISGWAKSFEETGKGRDSFQWNEALMERTYLPSGDTGLRVPEASERDYHDVEALDGVN